MNKMIENTLVNISFLYKSPVPEAEDEE